MINYDFNYYLKKNKARKATKKLNNLWREKWYSIVNVSDVFIIIHGIEFYHLRRFNYGDEAADFIYHLWSELRGAHLMKFSDMDSEILARIGTKSAQFMLTNFITYNTTTHQFVFTDPDAPELPVVPEEDPFKDAMEFFKNLINKLKWWK